MMSTGGADPSHADSHALRVAARNGHLRSVVTLVELGADVGAGNHEAFISAAGLGHEQVGRVT
jgi:hypothetical protein